MASEHTEQPGTDEAGIDRDRAQDTAVGTGEAPRVLPRPPAAPRLSPALSVTLNAALDRLLEVLGVDGGAVRLLEEETRDLVLVAHRGIRRRWPRTPTASKWGKACRDWPCNRRRPSWWSTSRSIRQWPTAPCDGRAMSPAWWSPCGCTGSWSAP